MSRHDEYVSLITTRYVGKSGALVCRSVANTPGVVLGWRADLWNNAPSVRGRSEKLRGGG
jgi:hypothetical protein